MYIPKSGSSVWSAITGGYEIPTLTQIYQSGDDLIIKGADATGDDLIIYPNQVDTYPYIYLNGNVGLNLYTKASSNIECYQGANMFLVFAGYTPHIALLETTSSPSNRGDYGQLYTKSDNNLYFKDGDGTEHTVGFV